MRTAGRCLLRESSSLSSANRIDEEAGVIHSVRVLGLRSSNGRRYLPEAVAAAAHLYEGKPVRLDHPDEPDETRSVDTNIGWLRNVRVGNDGGLYADLHYLKSHPFAPRLVEAARRHPRTYSLSHNADGETHVEGGVLVVTEITEVRSVDLVTDGATTESLFESCQRNKEKTTMKLREWFGRTRLLKPARRTIDRLFENKYLREDDDMEMPSLLNEPTDTAPPAAAADPAEMEPEEALRHGFGKAMHGILDDETMDSDTKLVRLKLLLKTRDKLISSGEEIPEEEEEELEEEEGLDDKEKPTLEASEEDEMPLEECDEMDKKMPESKRRKRDGARSLLLENKRLKAELESRALCENEGVKATPRLVKAMSLLESASERKEMVAEWKAAQNPRLVGKIRSGSTGTLSLTENRNGNSHSVMPGDDSTDGFLAAIGVKVAARG